MAKYIEVYESLKKAIIDKVYKPWSMLEGEVALSVKYNVSRPTIRKSIEKLKLSGFVHSRQGSGIFVNSPEFYEEYNLKSLSEKSQEKNRVFNKVIIFKKVFSDARISEIFNCELDTIFFYYKRVRVIDGESKILEETYMPEKLFKNFKKENIEQSVLDYIENKCHHKISHDLKEIKGHLLTEEEAIELNADIKELTLMIEHKVYLVKSVLAQYTKEIKLDNSYKVASVR